MKKSDRRKLAMGLYSLRQQEHALIEKRCELSDRLAKALRRLASHSEEYADGMVATLVQPTASRRDPRKFLKLAKALGYHSADALDAELSSCNVAVEGRPYVRVTP